MTPMSPWRHVLTHTHVTCHYQGRRGTRAEGSRRKEGNGLIDLQFNVKVVWIGFSNFIIPQILDFYLDFKSLKKDYDFWLLDWIKNPSQDRVFSELRMLRLLFTFSTLMSNSTELIKQSGNLFGHSGDTLLDLSVYQGRNTHPDLGKMNQ